MVCPGVFETKGLQDNTNWTLGYAGFVRLFFKGLDELVGDPFSATDRFKDIK